MTNDLITANYRHLDSALPMAKTCEGVLMATVHTVVLVMINAVYVQKLAGKLSEASPFEAFRSTLQPHQWYIYLLKVLIASLRYLLASCDLPPPPPPPWIKPNYESMFGKMWSAV